MVNSNNPSTLSPDKALTNPEDDRLGYAPFAKHLTESISKMTPVEGLVIGIYGPWGSGKTTLLNFMIHYFQQMPQTEQPIIVQFNPWWFSGHEDLTRRFFEQLEAVLSKRSIAKELTKRIADFAELVSEAPIPYVSIGGKVLVVWYRRRQKDVPELKAEIADMLRKQQKWILVIIDDIDRLTKEEIRQLFRVIKAVADFPNIIYLLAFDKEVAKKALAETQGISGEAYLEKIIQVPFELPLPDKTSLRQLFFEKLDLILADTPNELFDYTYWSNVYLDGIDYFINTPRDIVRLVNTLSVTYPAVKGEVNPVDFIAIETLRVFCPAAYDIIRKNERYFAGYVDRQGFLGPNVEDLKTFHNSWMDKVQDEYREPVKRLLMRIFPKLEAVWGNTHYGADWEPTWRKQLRVCSPDIFPIYFHLAVPEGSISNAEMESILALTNNAKAFREKLLELASQKRPDGTTRVRTFLERLEDFTEKEIPSENIPSIVQALFDVGDSLLCPEGGSGLFEFGNDIRILRIIQQLLLRLEESKRFEVLKDAILYGRAVSTIVDLVTAIGRQHGKYGAKQPVPEEKRLIIAEHLEELEKIALNKVRDAARQDSLLQTPDLKQVLYCWVAWAGEEEVKEWIQKVISTDKGLIRLLERSLKKTFNKSVSDVVGKTHYKLDLVWLERFIELSPQIIDRIERLAENSEISENLKIAIEQFIREYETMQQKEREAQEG
ncbi:KAP family NTPase [Archaeoglobus veneficus]|uniref:KAP P-loop domain protein n=1 Tax=Archaeoglobus veneficus (strain DSM 11195 / SNP6) TaxID=693661 RepID=F2KSC2_ARCVS|nr:P-loop NTPase fold protein [Archaeoglobus veneficus]AEA46891.1 KAP P-loop domain protein [Archaeoglobus veneficus SNP6]